MPFLTWRVYVALAVLVAFASLAAFGLVMRSQRDALRADYADYRTKMAQAAEAAAEQALKKTIADEQRKEQADAEVSTALGTLADSVGRMRVERDNAISRFVSAAASCPGRPDGADREARFERAYRALVAGLRELGLDDDKRTVKLNGAKEWASAGRSP